MPTAAGGSRVAIAVVIALGVLVVLVWAVQLATLFNLTGSDAAGNGLAQAFGAFEILLLWALLAVLMLVAVVMGAIPWPASVPALILVPASGYAAITALALLSEPGVAPFMWPIIVPALVPPLVLGFCFSAVLPPLRGAIPVGLAAATVWGATLVLSAAIWPMDQMRHVVYEQAAALSTKWDSDFASLPANSPLWDWTPFLGTPVESKEGAVLDGIRHLDRRQSDAEIMLDRGDFPLRYLASMDLDPTPALCEKARGLLDRRVGPLVLKTPNSKPYTEIANEMDGIVGGMEWLVGYGCALDAESQAWETMANAYRDPNFDVVRLAELRDPKNLGRKLREDPASFSMLTPEAHLKAWLKFADGSDTGKQALAGARKLDHRTADAVEMLNQDEYTARTLMGYLPYLDLEATPPLCDGAERFLDKEIAQIYRPREDDPRPYEQLMERTGGGSTFDELKWLAEHGCDTNAELTDAVSLVRAYQDLPARAAMLASLAQLQQKP